MFDNDAHKKDEIRVGVYTCKCGGNISDVVSCEAVAQALGEQANVVISRTAMSMCSDAGQALIEEDIKERGVNRIVIGACAEPSASGHKRDGRRPVSRSRSCRFV